MKPKNSIDLKKFIKVSKKLLDFVNEDDSFYIE